MLRQMYLVATPRVHQPGVNQKPLWLIQRGRAVAGKLGRFQQEISSEIENSVPGRDMQSVHLNDSGTNS